MRFSRQEYWSGLPCPPPGNLLDPGIKPMSLMSPAMAGGLFTPSTTWEAHNKGYSSPMSMVLKLRNPFVGKATGSRKLISHWAWVLSTETPPVASAPAGCHGHGLDHLYGDQESGLSSLSLSFFTLCLGKHTWREMDKGNHREKRKST